jgi:hypothetical protein
MNKEQLDNLIDFLKEKQDEAESMIKNHGEKNPFLGQQYFGEMLMAQIVLNYIENLIINEN